MTEVVVKGDAPPWTLADRLRKAREHRGLDQTELADLMGVSQRSIRNYEAGRTTPRRPQLIAWAFATGVSLEWLEDVRPKGLEPLTFWLGAWRYLRVALLGRRRPRGLVRRLASGQGGAVRSDDLAALCCPGCGEFVDGDENGWDCPACGATGSGDTWDLPEIEDVHADDLELAA
jgi:transcriptional regulator with XRE-family HTH domain